MLGPIVICLSCGTDRIMLLAPTSSFRDETLVWIVSYKGGKSKRTLVKMVKLSPPRLMMAPGFVTVPELLQISHWQSPQTCVPAVFSQAPSRQRTPATTHGEQRVKLGRTWSSRIKSHYIRVQIMSDVNETRGHKIQIL